MNQGPLRAASVAPQPLGPVTTSVVGGLLALALFAAWIGVLCVSLPIPLAAWEPWQAVLVVALQTWLSTGLFIVAHDAMHGTLLPVSRRWNDRLGRSILLLYAFFPWRRMVHEHRRHHRAPGTAQDPDFHDADHPGFWRWYGRFLWAYVTPWQFLGFAVTYNLLAHAAGIDQGSLWVFWITPLLLSTVQLFTFGTWLPHRASPTGHADWHRAASNDWPTWLSLLTCFHFGYHWEHHAWPSTPWWRLPYANRLRRGARPLQESL